MIFIIGCGGVGSWLAPAICPLIGPGNVTLVDGDTLEEKNLDRQLFDLFDIGKNKAEALAERYKCTAAPQWYSESMTQHAASDWLLVAVDNHAARKAALIACDLSQCRGVFAANETHSSEAYVYLPSWRGTDLDPRVYYPEIMTDTSGDPRRAAIGCTGEAQVANRQLVTANMMAASLAAHLFMVWSMEAVKMSKEGIKHLPFKLVNNLSRNEYYKISGATKKETQNESNK